MASPGKLALENRRSFLRAALFALIVLAPLPFGGVESHWLLAIELYAVLLGGLAYSIYRDDAGCLTAKGRRLAIPAGVLLTIGTIQIIPVPAIWTRWIAPTTADAREAVAGVLPDLAAAASPQSLEPPASLDALLRLTAYVLIGLSAALAIRTRAHLKQAMVAVAASASFQAMYGAAEYLSGHQHIFGFAKKFYLDDATGTFINRSHFSGFLAMSLPLALGLALGRGSPPDKGSWRDRILALTEPAGFLRIAGAMAAGSIWIGVVLSYSRGGMAAALTATGLVALWHATRTRRTRVLPVFLLLLVPTVWLIVQDVRAPGERFLSQGTQVSTLDLRLRVWQTAGQMVPDFPVFGSGLGTFEEVFDVYRPADVRKVWNHAHNDWLQSLVEAGPAGFVAMLMLLAMALMGPAGRWGPRWSRYFFVNPVTAGIVAIAVHSAVDFCLRIPANAVLAAFLVGCAASPAWSERIVRSRNRDTANATSSEVECD